MDTFLTIVSKRDLRSYAPDPLPEDVLRRILEAGRMTGNAKNRQLLRFVVLSAATRARAAAMVTRPSNLEQAGAAVALVAPPDRWADFDAGRTAQNMMLAAWNEDVGSCPNAVADGEGMSDLLNLGKREEALILLSFGFPTDHHGPNARSAGEWLRRADRSPLEDRLRKA